jgi:hypothetical protein
MCGCPASWGGGGGGGGGCSDITKLKLRKQQVFPSLSP